MYINVCSYLKYASNTFVIGSKLRRFVKIIEKNIQNDKKIIQFQENLLLNA